MAFTFIKLSETFETPEGAKRNGKITATLSRVIQNEEHMIPVTPIKLTITNGVLAAASQLAANNDTGTLPEGTFYTFKVELSGAAPYEFNAVVPHEAAGGKISISKLYESSGTIGLKPGMRPTLSASASNNQITQALFELGLINLIPAPPGFPTFFPY